MSVHILVVWSRHSVFDDICYNIHLSCKQVTNVLISLRECAGWSGSALSAICVRASFRTLIISFQSHKHGAQIPDKGYGIRAEGYFKLWERKCKYGLSSNPSKFLLNIFIFNSFLSNIDIVFSSVDLVHVIVCRIIYWSYIDIKFGQMHLALIITIITWAAPCEKMSSVICEQQRPWWACASAQSDQDPTVRCQKHSILYTVSIESNCPDDILRMLIMIWIYAYWACLKALFSLNATHMIELTRTLGALPHCIPNRLSRTIYCKSLISILGTSGYKIYIFLEKNGWTICKQWRPWSDAAFCGVWSGSALFANYPFTGLPTTMS